MISTQILNDMRTNPRNLNLAAQELVLQKKWTKEVLFGLRNNMTHKETRF